jgi:type IV pilus assembly protein PilM
VSDSIWKKELSLKRKPKTVADPEAFELPKQSLLKKEISFKRKPKPEQGSPAPATAEKQSFLKKDISFGRKPKAEQGSPAPAKAEKQSFLKKDISFGRKPKPEAEPGEPKQSIWKKDLSLARGGKAEREVERLAQAAAQAIEAPAIEAQAVPFEVVQPTELAEAVLAAMPDPNAAPVAADPVPADPVPAEPVPAEPAFPVEAPVLDELEVVDPTPTFEPGPAPEVDLAPVEPLAIEPADTWVAEPELPPAPAAPLPVTVHPPVPAAELPPVADSAPKAPFWKKELSLSRKQPKPAKTPPAPKPAKVAGAPFWKKELSLGRKRTTADAVTEALPAAKSEPFWKRGVSLPKPGLPARRAKGGGHKAQKLVGLKVGASQLAAARISNNGVAELLQVARDPLASGVVVAGELRDPEALGDALKVFFARHKLPKKGVRLGIASNRIGVRILDIAGVAEEKQLANAVQFRAQEALPIPLDEAVLDYRVLEEAVDADGQSVKRVLLVVAYRELIDRYVSACQKAGIVLAGIDLEAFALLRALGAPADRAGSALVAVAIGHDRSTFAVSDGRTCEFTRVVEWGGSALNIALARAFDSTPSEVEQIKRELSLDGSVVPEELTPEQGAAALDAVRRQIQSFARELVSSLQFYQNQPGSLGIGEIVITGGTAQLPGLAEELERLIGVHVRIGNPLARLKVPKRLAGTEQIGSLAVAIGLGIED